MEVSLRRFGISAVSKKQMSILALLTLGCICIFFITTTLAPYYARMKNAEMAWNWEGFGPERGHYNFTLVTALFDIGRGSWVKQSRDFNSYLMHMQRVLRLDVNVVAFVEDKAEPFLRWIRRGRETRTRIEVTTFSDLPYFKYRDRMQQIMNSPEYKKDNELVQQGLAESVYPEYDIIQLSKLYFIDWAVERNPFNTTCFLWLDAGYGHGKAIHPPDGIWNLQNVAEFPNQITFLERSPGIHALESQKDVLHKLSVNVLPGGFFAGMGKTLQVLYKLQREELKRWMDVGIVDDDQTMNMLIYYKNQSLFHLVPGNWNEVFKLFNSHKS